MSQRTPRGAAAFALGLAVCFASSAGGCDCDSDEDEMLGMPDAGKDEGATAKPMKDGEADDEELEPGGVMGPGGVEEREPNDDRGKATDLKAGGKILGHIFNKDEDVADADWYRIEVPDGEKPQKLKIELGALAGADLAIEIYKGPNKVLTVDKNKEDGVGELVNGFGVKPGPYFIKIEAKSVDGAVFSHKEKRYSLETEIKEVKEGEEVEPNDGVATAMPAKAGAPLTGSFSVPGDTDYFTLGPDGMEPGSVLSISVTAVNGVAMSMTLLDGIKDKVKTASAGVGEKLSIKNIGVKPENVPYYIALKATSGSNADQDYTVTLTLTKLDGDAELEPNDDPVHATPIEGGKRVKAFFSKGDKDLFKISVPEKGIVKVAVEGCPDVNLKVRLIDEKGAKVSKTINENGMSEGEDLTNWTIPPGDTYIEVTSSAGFNDDVPYSVGLGIIGDEGFLELEPNDELTSATPIIPDKGDGTNSRKGYLHPKNDRDYYLLDLGFGKEETFHIKLTGIAKVNLDLDITDEAGTRIADASDKFTKAAAGYPEEADVTLNGSRFYLVVKSAKAGIFNPRDEYILSVVKK